MRKKRAQTGLPLKVFKMKSKTAPIVIAILIPVVSVLAAISLIYLKKTSESNGIEFPYGAYIENPKSLAGNKYLLRAEFELQLALIGGGRVVSVRDSLSGKNLAVYIPPELNANIMTRQRYEMDVSVGDGGRIIVNSMQKF